MGRGLKTTSEDVAKKTLESQEINKYKDEIEYISKQLTLQKSNVDDVKENETKTKIVFHLTGFGEFAGVKDNPTTHLIHNLPKRLENAKDIPSNVTIASMNVLHVSGVNSLKKLKEIRQSNDKNAKDTVYVYLHFGVAASRKTISLESVAYNCADFSGAPDMLGWGPKNEMIVKENANIFHEYCTTLPVDTLQSIMASKQYKVEKSTDPGRYVCNWILYNSLHLTCKNENEYAMFVHVPLFKVIDEETQSNFAKDLIVEISKLLNWKFNQ